MRTRTRLTRWLVMAFILMIGLTGCFKSAGGSLVPTPGGDRGVTQAAVNPTLEIPPTFTPMAEASDTPVLIEPTAEDETPLPTPFPTMTPFVKPTTAVPTAFPTLVPNPNPVGPVATNTPSPVVVMMVPTQTRIPPTATPTVTPVPPTATFTQTPPPTALPASPTLPVTATFTSVPFAVLPATPTYTPFIPPASPTFAPPSAIPQPPVEAQPLGEQPTQTLPAPTQIGQGGLEVAQVPTLNPNQATATALVYGATVTEAFLQGTVIPVATFPGQPVVITQLPGMTPVPGGQVIVVTPTPVGRCNTHLIAPGETLSRIALIYNVTIAQIAQANNIVNPDLIRAGDTLNIPCPVPATPTPIPTAAGVVQPGTGQGGMVTGPTTYIVEPGDNIYRISLRFGVSMAALMQANGLTPATINMIYAGQQLYIPAATIVPTPVPTLPGQQQPGQVLPSG